MTTDPDTDEKQLIYEITNDPRNGYVENKLKPGTTVTTFSQGMEDGLCVVAFFLQLLLFIKIVYIWGEEMVGRTKTRSKIILLTTG